MKLKPDDDNGLHPLPRVRSGQASSGASFWTLTLPSLCQPGQTTPKDQHPKDRFFTDVLRNSKRLPDCQSGMARVGTPQLTAGRHLSPLRVQREVQTYKSEVTRVGTPQLTTGLNCNPLCLQDKVMPCGFSNHVSIVSMPEADWPGEPATGTRCHYREIIKSADPIKSGPLLDIKAQKVSSPLWIQDNVRHSKSEVTKVCTSQCTSKLYLSPLRIQDEVQPSKSKVTTPQRPTGLKPDNIEPSKRKGRKLKASKTNCPTVHESQSISDIKGAGPTSQLVLAEPCDFSDHMFIVSLPEADWPGEAATRTSSHFRGVIKSTSPIKTGPLLDRRAQNKRSPLWIQDNVRPYKSDVTKVSTSQCTSKLYLISLCIQDKVQPSKSEVTTRQRHTGLMHGNVSMPEADWPGEAATRTSSHFRDVIKSTAPIKTGPLLDRGAQNNRSPLWIQDNLRPYKSEVTKVSTSHRTSMLYLSPLRKQDEVQPSK